MGRIGSGSGPTRPKPWTLKFLLAENPDPKYLEKMDPDSYL